MRFLRKGRREKKKSNDASLYVQKDMRETERQTDKERGRERGDDKWIPTCET